MSTAIEKIKINNELFVINEADRSQDRHILSLRSEAKMYLAKCGIYDSIADARAAAAGLIDHERCGPYRLFSRIAEGGMKQMGDFDDLESAQTRAERLELSKN